MTPGELLELLKQNERPTSGGVFRGVDVGTFRVTEEIVNLGNAAVLLGVDVHLQEPTKMRHLSRWSTQARTEGLSDFEMRFLEYAIETVKNVDLSPYLDYVDQVRESQRSFVGGGLSALERVLSEGEL